MNLNEQVNQDLISAMKAKNELILSTLRMLKSAIKNREIEFGHQLNETEIGEVVAKSVKQRKDSIAEYRKGNRNDLVKKETEEMKILGKYLPKQLSEDEIKKVVEEAIAKTKPASVKDMGKVMAQVMPKLKGRADGSIISKIVRNKLE